MVNEFQQSLYVTCAGAPHVASVSGKFCAGVSAETVHYPPAEPKPTSADVPSNPNDWTDAQPRVFSDFPEASPSPSPKEPPAPASGSGGPPPAPVSVPSGSHSAAVASAPITPTQPETTAPGSPMATAKSSARSPTYWK